MAARVIDYSALTEPVTASQVIAWRRQMRITGVAWITTDVQSGLVVGVGIFFVVVALIFFNGFTFTFDGVGLDPAVGAAIRIAVIAVIALIVGIALWRWARGGGPWTRRYRLAHFAEANGMAYSPAQPDPRYPGMIFTAGRDHMALDHLDTTTGRFLDMGNFRWVTGSGRDRTTHTWGFLALSLDRAMPNIVLDSRANNTFLGSNLPVSLNRDQVLHLEGDFDRYFTLYCPQQYQQDALYIFTPDLMALLIDEAASYDVELVDRWMFVYSSSPFDMNDPATLQRLFRIADTVGAKALDQTERYADARVGDAAANIVAPQGARLRRGIPVAAVILIAALVIAFGWGVLGPVIRTLTGG